MEMCVMVRKGKGVRHFQTEYPLTDGGGLIISIIRACPLLSLLAQHTPPSLDSWQWPALYDLQRRTYRV